MQPKKADIQGALSHAEADKQAEMPEHLIALPGGQWRLWRWAGLRGAGFPVKQVINLASPACADAADQVLQAECAAKQARNQLIDMLQHQLDAADGKNKPALLREIIRLKKGKTPARLAAGVGLEAPSEQYRQLRARLDSVRVDYAQSFKRESVEVSKAIHEVIKDNRFREALIWQNRHAYHGSIQALIKMPPGAAERGAERRKREELVANYLQRYCTKNDTIGFFGPVGWANLTSHGNGIIAMPGATLLSSRSVYFEVWCIDTVAKMLAGDKRLQPWIAPRRQHFLHVEGTMLYMPSRPPVKLSPQEAAILQACDGDRTANEIASSLIGNQMTTLDTEESVYSVLEELRERGLISWTLEVPIELHPERSLKRMLERIEDEELRASSLEMLAEIEAGRQNVICASGDAEKLDQALGDLESTFTRRTGAFSVRFGGQMYAGRTLVYEDCRRNIEVDIGPDIVSSVGPALSLLLASARWLMFKATEAHRRLFEKMFDDLARRTSSRTVDFVTFWYRLYPLLFTEDDSFTDKLASIFQKRWSKILSIPPAKNRVSYTSQELARPVKAAFNAPHPGCKAARYNSPDLMIAAPSVEAIRRGEYDLVLGELHVGVNTLRFSVFLSQHPAPDELLRAHHLDLPETRAVPVIPKSFWPVKSGRLVPALTSPSEIHLEFGSDPSCDGQAAMLPIGSLVVEDSSNGLIIRTRDGKFRFDAVETTIEMVVSRAVNSFKILAPAPHRPRVNIDRIVVSRESWTFDASEIEFARETNDAERFIAARRWAIRHNMPRFLFVKVPVEVKPFYVDLDSTIYVSVFAKAIRRNLEKRPTDSTVTVTEMLPRPDQAWLPDAGGQLYTSELRIVAVDSSI